MVRGVNRNIIEVNCTESKYFDRVLLFVDPSSNLTDEQIAKKAGDYINLLESGRIQTVAKKPRKKYILTAVAVLISAAVSAGITAAILSIL